MNNGDDFDEWPRPESVEEIGILSRVKEFPEEYFGSSLPLELVISLELIEQYYISHSDSFEVVFDPNAIVLCLRRDIAKSQLELERVFSLPSLFRAADNSLKFTSEHFLNLLSIDFFSFGDNGEVGNPNVLENSKEFYALKYKEFHRVLYICMQNEK